MGRPTGGGGRQSPTSTRSTHTHTVLTRGFLQAFASEKVFGVLSEKLYEVLQLVGAGGPGPGEGPRTGWVRTA